MSLALMLSVVQFLISFALMGLIFDKVDTVLISISFFGAAFTIFCYSDVALLVPTDYAPHAMLLMIQPILFFLGVFFVWGNLSKFFKIRHYLNPFFYCVMAITQLGIRRL
jgi:hypothetical protein